MILIILLLLWVLPSLCLAAGSQVTGIGLVAGNLLEPVHIVSDFVASAAIVVGVTSLFGAFLKYMQHRVNPLVAPISTVIVLLIIGIVLVSLPLIYMLTESGIPYSLHL